MSYSLICHLARTKNHYQYKIDRILVLLRNQVQFEKNRENKLTKLTWALQAAIISKDEEVKNDERTTAEMTDLRNKMEDSTISTQLDVVIAQKEALTSIDRCQLANLNEILQETQHILQGTRSLMKLIEETLSQVLPLTAGDKIYDFSHLTKLENVWKSASELIDTNEVRMREMKVKFDNDRLNKFVLLGEPIPESLQNAAKRVEKRSLKASANAMGTESGIVPSFEQQTSSQIVALNGIPPVKQVEELESKDEGEIAGVLAMAVGKAAVASAKASVFGIRALFETFNSEEVSQVTGQVVKSSSQISKVSAGGDLKSGIKSTGDTLDAIGKVGQVVANKVSSVDSGAKANVAWQETSNDIVEAFNAVTALSRKLLNKKDGNGPTFPPVGKN